MADNLDKILEQEIAKEFKPQLVNKSPLTPKGIAQAVEEATNTDTDRTTRMMLEQHKKISEGLQRQIEEATEVRKITTKYIEDLNTALTASNATIEMLTKK